MLQLMWKCPLRWDDNFSSSQTFLSIFHYLISRDRSPQRFYPVLIVFKFLFILPVHRIDCVTVRGRTTLTSASTTTTMAPIWLTASSSGSKNPEKNRTSKMRQRAYVCASWSVCVATWESMSTYLHVWVGVLTWEIPKWVCKYLYLGRYVLSAYLFERLNQYVLSLCKSWHIPNQFSLSLEFVHR